MTKFSDLGLAAPLLKALDAEGYSVPTPIQAQAIPPVMAGRDVLGIAQTGTGKTAAFALPILHRLAADKRQPPRKGTRVLVLSPTRELASQIAESFRTYGRNMGVSVAVVFGGVGFRPQVNALARGVDVLVATPGRLIDHMTEKTIDLIGTEVLVLDEADQMLDLGFFPGIRRICSAMTAKRQNLLFSATMPSEIGKLADGILKDPVKVSVAPVATTVEKVDQRVILIEQKRKKDVLIELLADKAMTRTLVFTRTKRGADRVAEHLETAKISVAAIHGNKGQSQREKALAAFRDNKIRVLVATDIAARGIDVDLVTHVVNYELPDVPESYVHRIGRTARAGAAGIAIALVDHEERGQLRDIERLTRQSIPSEDRRDPNAKPSSGGEPRDKERRRDGHRGRNGARPGQPSARNGEGRGRSNGHAESRASAPAREKDGDWSPMPKLEQDFGPVVRDERPASRPRRDDARPRSPDIARPHQEDGRPRRDEGRGKPHPHHSASAGDARRDGGRGKDTPRFGAPAGHGRSGDKPASSGGANGRGAPRGAAPSGDRNRGPRKPFLRPARQTERA